MTPDAFRAELARLGLTQVGAGRALRVNEKTVRRWAAGEIPIPFAVELLLPKLTPREARKMAKSPDREGSK